MSGCRSRVLLGGLGRLALRLLAAAPRRPGPIRLHARVNSACVITSPCSADRRSSACVFVCRRADAARKDMLMRSHPGDQHTGRRCNGPPGRAAGSRCRRTASAPPGPGHNPCGRRIGLGSEGDQCGAAPQVCAQGLVESLFLDHGPEPLLHLTRELKQACEVGLDRHPDDHPVSLPRSVPPPPIQMRNNPERSERS